MESKDYEEKNVSPAAEERSVSGGNAPQAGGEAAGCLSNTQGNSSHPTLPNFPEYGLAGGIDWFEWTAWAQRIADSTSNMSLRVIAEAKERCQQSSKPYVKLTLWEFGEIHVHRQGLNRGGAKGQHFEYKLSIRGATIGISPRNIEECELKDRRNRPTPNFCVQQTGRHCLLVGLQEVLSTAEVLLEILGYRILEKVISRADMCLDVSYLNPARLLSYVQRDCYITQAHSVKPEIDFQDEDKADFVVGKKPRRFIVYDKYKERFGVADALYNRALIERRWHGKIPPTATRLEFQLGRPYLRKKSIDTPEQFLDLCGKLAETLTYDFFRLTESPVDRKRKHQSRAETAPIWKAIQEGFRQVFGEPLGEFKPIDRQAVEPLLLARMARGALANCLLQRGERIVSYSEFAKKAGELLVTQFRDPVERQRFLTEIERRRLKYEA